MHLPVLYKGKKVVPLSLTEVQVLVLEKRQDDKRNQQDIEFIYFYIETSNAFVV